MIVLMRVIFGAETGGPSWDTVLLVIGGITTGLVGGWFAFRRDKEATSSTERMALLAQWQMLDAAKSKEIVELNKKVDDLELRVDEAEAEAAACQRREANNRVEMSSLTRQLEDLRKTIAKYHGEGE